MKLGMLKLGLLASALSGCSGAGPAEPEPARRAAFAAAWAEFLPPTEIEAALPLLERHAVAVNVAWPSATLDSPALVSLVKHAEATGVEVRPWLLLPEADGYWPGSTNAVAFAAAARGLMDVWDANGFAPTTLVVDMELRKDRSDLLTEQLSAGDVIAAIELLKAGMDRPTYESATQEYAALVTDAKSRGWTVHLTTLPQVLDDYADGDDALRQGFGIPVEGIAWDFVTFQAYRTLFGDLLGSGAPPTSYFVYSYGKDAQNRFGARAGLDVGMVGHGVSPSSTYESGADLAADLAAAAAAGIPRASLNVYNLDGVLSRTPSEQWLTGPHPGTPPPEDEATLKIRKNVTILDGVL